MVQPFNYSIGQQPSFAENLSYMQAIKGQQMQQQAQRVATQQQDLANQQLKRQLAGIDAWKASDKNLEDYQALGIELGGDNISKLGEAFQQQTDLENQNIIKFGGQFLSALQANPQYAVTMLDDRIAATQQSDPTTAKFFGTIRKMLADESGAVKPDNVEAVQMMAGATLAAVPGAKDMFDTLNVREQVLKQRQLTPIELKKAKSEANKAATDAKWAETTASANLANMGLDLSDQVEDPEIAKQIKALANLKSEEAKALSGLQRQKLQLQIQKAEQEAIDLAAKKKDEIRVAQVQAERGSQLIDQIFEIGERSDYLGATDVFGTATGTFQSGIFTFDQDVADLEEAVGTLQSQVFLSEVGKMRGLGTLTDAEGIRLEQSIRSLSFRQSRDQFVDNLQTIKELLKKNAEETEKKFGRNVAIPGGDVTDVDPQARTVTVGGVTYTVEEEAE